MDDSVTNKSSKKTEPQAHWSSIKEAGTLLGLRFLWLVHTVFGRWLVSLMLLPTVAYFLVFRPLTRRSSQAYLLKHYRQYPESWSRKPGVFDVARHLYEFAQTVVDKLLSWFIDIDADKFHLSDIQQKENMFNDPKGQLIIGSHFGNLEYCRGFMHRYKDRIINILVHDKHSENYNTLMQQLNPESRLHILQVEEFDISTMLRIKAKIDAGEWVFIAGDRSPLSGVSRTVDVEFMGQTAALPIGPYMLAKGLACPVQLMFTACDYASKDKTVLVDIINFANPVTLDRKNRDSELQAYAQRYADELEKKCAQFPYQWFNFYDFWAKPEAAK